MDWKQWCIRIGFFVICASAAFADADFYLKDGDTIVFFGDSITQAGTYVIYVDAYLATRFPGKHFRVVNRGLSSETVAGTSEPGHDPVRPWAHDRFSRDIPPLNPDVVVACYGMNDGGYAPLDAGRFQKYKTGYRRLIERIWTETNAELTFMTPPPYDPYKRRVGDPDAKTYGYRFPAVNYDDTLGQYSDWLLTLRDEGFVVADVHTATNDFLAKRRQGDVSFFLAGDAVHPGPTGHWLMAQTLLEAWNAPADCAQVVVDAAELDIIDGAASNLNSRGDAIEFEWFSPLPMPVDSGWDERSIRTENVAERLNRYRLTVTGLKPGRYVLQAEGQAIAELDSSDLAEGVDLTKFASFPTNERSREVLALTTRRQKMLYGAWRKEIALRLDNDDTGGVRNEIEKTRREADGLLAPIEDLCQPRTLHVTLSPVDSE